MRGHSHAFLSIFTFLFLAFTFLNTDVSAFDGEILVPDALKKGDTVCVLEPSRTTKYREKTARKRLPSVIKNLEKRGF